MSDYLEPGDLLVFYRTGYRHWAVYSYDDQVIHFTDDGWIREVDFEDVKENSQVAYECNYSPFSKEEIVKRARYLKGHRNSGRFNVVFNNCEHFAKWCRYNRIESSQAKAAWASFGTALLAPVWMAAAGAVAPALVLGTLITTAASVATATLSSSSPNVHSSGKKKSEIHRRLKTSYKCYN
ncbi:phospholipase A and acyltransferase 1-like [Gigantopelta aegis]|uniref:phospholipase A and acyltransferase 1-like n=1 Tax=Gigantopelta aegis TaxID=1735272 RepID=UPI001B88B2A0|nr:phospholipase A and acyltransferase 1-like [Gigantopelta aegis]